MTTASSRSEWNRPVLVGSGEARGMEDAPPVGTVARPNAEPDRGTLTLTDFPEVGRVQEVAAVLRCSKWCVYDLINSGALKSIRLGRAIRVTRRALEEFLAV
jgi:excisionase family DNA binding protein